MNELIVELRGYIAAAKAEDGEDWGKSEIRIYARDLEALLDKVDPSARENET